MACLHCFETGLTYLTQWCWNLSEKLTVVQPVGKFPRNPSSLWPDLDEASTIFARCSHTIHLINLSLPQVSTKVVSLLLTYAFLISHTTSPPAPFTYVKPCIKHTTEGYFSRTSILFLFIYSYWVIVLSMNKCPCNTRFLRRTDSINAPLFK